ncbi:MAG: RICIN domain-containing protein [Solitalea-like symbiont of Tyrophagus putrescentiae]
MKKLLLLTILFLVSIISCNKEKSLTIENSQSKKQSIEHAGAISVKNYVISNCVSMDDKVSYIFPVNNEDMAMVWDYETRDVTLEMGWYMEYLNNGYMRFWAQNKGFLEYWRVLDIDWRHPNEDNSITAVMWRPNTGANQQWELIGSKRYTNDGKTIAGFRGVIVNKYSGRMLQLKYHYAQNGRKYRYVVSGDLYDGSEEQKYYNTHGNFETYCYTTKKTTIWYVEKFDFIL